MSRLKVGVLGCGKISTIYLTNLTGRFADLVEVVACADVVIESARERAEAFGVARACGPDELLADPSVELVLNLTPAPAHHAVSMQVLNAGKHLYSEKPLALSMDHAREILALAEAKGLRVSCAPDTILGAGVQTCRKIIDDGLIGDPVAAHAMVSIGLRGERYFKVFRGPLLDLGPYHVGALITLLGPVRAVSGAAQPARRRADADEALSDEAVTIDAPANSAAVLEFVNGCLVTLIATAETTGYMPALKVFGTAGVLTGTDPNKFTDGIILHRAGEKEPREVAPTHGYGENCRGIGVAELARSIVEDRPQRLSPGLALHGLEVMLAVIESARTGRRVELETTCDRPAPMAEGAASDASGL